MIESRVLAELSDGAWAAEMKRRALAAGYTWGDVPIDYAAFRDAVLEQAPKDLAELGVPHAHLAWEKARTNLRKLTERAIAEAASLYDDIVICLLTASIWVRRGAPEPGPSLDDWREAQLRIAAVDYTEIAAELDRDIDHHHTTSGRA